MTRDQLRLQLASAVERHARTLQDHGGRAGPALLDDLEQVAEEHARQHALSIEESHRGEHVLAPAVTVTTGTGSQTLGGPAGPLKADDLPPVKTSSPGPLPTSRTRTRTRG